MKKVTTLLGVAILLALSACSSESSEEPESAASDSSDSEVSETEQDLGLVDASDECQQKAALFVTKGSANEDLEDPEVSATCSGDTMTVNSNSIPDYTYIMTSPGIPRVQELTFDIPDTPTVTGEPTEAQALGAIAIALNGVPIYGPSEGPGGDVLTNEGLLSECGSHNGPGGFHIHLISVSDSTDCLFTPEEIAAEPQLVGYAFDGFPIYTGDSNGYTSSWELTDESLFASDTWEAHTYVEGSGDLDECNGLTDENGQYAYYTTSTFPYVLGCYTGEFTQPERPEGEGGPGGGEEGADGDRPEPRADRDELPEDGEQPEPPEPREPPENEADR